MAKQSITIPRAPGRIKTFRPTNNGNSYLVELVIDVTMKEFDAAIEDIFAGYIQKVASMSQAQSPAEICALKKKPAEVNLAITSGGEPEETVLRWIGAKAKAPRLHVSKDGAKAEIYIGIVGPLDNEALGTVATYRGADVMIAIEPTQVDLEDTADAPKVKRAPRRRATASAVQLTVMGGEERVETIGDDVH